MNKAEQKLRDYLYKMADYNQAAKMLSLDMATHMPREGFERHRRAMGRLSGELFRLYTNPELKELLAKLAVPENYKTLDAGMKFTVDTMLKEFEEKSRIPEALNNEYVSERALADKKWKEAKAAKDFSLFKEQLQKVVDLKKEIIRCKHPDKPVYEALLNECEEGMDTATYDRLFNDLKACLVPLIKDILSKPEPDDSKFVKTYNLDHERAAQEYLLKYIGFDYNRGTTAETEHPFTSAFSSRDVRITNHFHEDTAIRPMFSSIHEGGHAIFVQNVNPDFDGLPADNCIHAGLHESQSRFYENTLGHNINFWRPIYKDIQGIVPEFEGISLEEFNREINHVRNSFIRTCADEVTYCLHIIIRYELEKEMFVNNVPVGDIRDMWNEKMREYLGITPPDDSLGILQDMHWANNYYGYFPTYLLGSIYDGMFLQALERDMGPVDSILADGKILDITKWLNKNIHFYGSTRTPAETIMAVCHEPVSAKPLCDYFMKKYGELYGL